MSDYDIPEEDDFGPFHVEHLSDGCAVYDAFLGKYTLYYPTESEARAACAKLEEAAQTSSEKLDWTYENLRKALR